MSVKVVGRFREELLPQLAPYHLEILPTETPTAPELVISYGGDGTLLGAERDFPGIPKLALRDHTHDPRCEKHSSSQALQAFFQGETRSESYVKLLAKTANGEERIALNDIVIGRQMHPLSAIRCRVSQDGNLIQPQVIADALVIATPYGSTGYFHSITRGSFQTGIGLAYSNAVDGQGFEIFHEQAKLDIEILRGPAIVQAGNNPDALNLQDGDHLTVSLAPTPATIFGLEAFRCRECYLRRRNAVC